MRDLRSRAFVYPNLAILVILSIVSLVAIYSSCAACELDSVTAICVTSTGSTFNLVVRMQPCSGSLARTQAPKQRATCSPQ